MTGRLRTKWALIHSDEVYFRDTANGLLAWAVALIVSMAFLASAASSMAGRTPQIASTSSTIDPNAYYVDKLFRSYTSGPGANNAIVQPEAARIFDNALRENQFSSSDQTYLAHLISARTGISQSEAEKRVSDVFVEARGTEDSARKATAHFLLWSFVALLAGAFSTSLGATIGGRQRDRVKTA